MQFHQIPMIAKEKIIKCLSRYIKAHDNLRKNPQGCLSSPVDKNSIVGQEYIRLSKIHIRCLSDLWMITDIEYDDTEFIKAVWNWRYCKVLARKCCWYQLKFGNTNKAGRLMSKLHKAENELIRVCGL